MPQVSISGISFALIDQDFSSLNKDIVVQPMKKSGKRIKAEINKLQK